MITNSVAHIIFVVVASIRVQGRLQQLNSAEDVRLDVRTAGGWKRCWSKCEYFSSASIIHIRMNLEMRRDAMSMTKRALLFQAQIFHSYDTD